ncbi:hypothetical protein [Mucilaginibacter segetis]|uniref:Elp3/MiaA/NifB-like radical SAM core domain-containing protein n=1 Tax=Mucilaginibacter segetis TaxID=2793071 RepID=A0A934ULD2_9SPHI|nr:hypothetical protein [Mucilaginibacter segetis]MBK0378428.1 hypothetical protein [Mucilaginibacter segetis]
MHDNREIEQLRPARNVLDPDVPYHFMHEHEPDREGRTRRVNTIFLTGKECAFKCLMCDLWKNTLPGTTPPGSILKQIDHSLERLPDADVVKLYNSSNFFDPKAVPPSDYAGIVERLRGYERVIVENHPKLSGKACVEFNKQLSGTLEIAMGLETIHPDVLPKLNKQMTAEDFRSAAKFLTSNGIDVRTFILLNPPYLKGKTENVNWAVKAVEFAFESGAQCCSVIATRAGNGIMDKLHLQGLYTTPGLDDLEEAFERSLNLKRGRVFVDTWEIDFLSSCPHCFEARKQRLNAMNANQKNYPEVSCSYCDTHA